MIYAKIMPQKTNFMMAAVDILELISHGYYIMNVLTFNYLNQRSKFHANISVHI